MTLRWSGPVEEFEHGPLRFRVALGEKRSKTERPDLRLDLFVPGFGWWPIKMSLAFFLADFLGENEDQLYPPSEGYRGGRKFIEFCRMAYSHGWEVAQRQLEAEQRQKGLFDELGDAS